MSGGKGFHGTATRKGVFGMTSDGSHAEFMAVPRANETLVMVPDELSFEEGVLFSCSIPVGFSAVERAQPMAGDAVAVVGLGPIGLCCTLAAAVRGVGRLVAVDPIPYRREAALSLGASEAIDPSKLADYAGATNGGRGFDRVLVVTTMSEAVEQALASTRVCGRVTLVATLRQAQLNLRHLLSRGIDLVGLRATNRPSFFARVLDLARNDRISKKQLRTLMTHEVPLTEIRRAFDLIEKKTDNLIKVVIRP
jgi:threonine dehydrogenase-like Zn-dependent dehydrogenase